MIAAAVAGKAVACKTCKGKCECDDDKKKAELPCFRGQSPAQIQAFTAFAKKMTTIGITGLLKQYNDELKNYTGNITRQAHDENQKKNRYKDVVCADGSRVILPDGTYIHANYVQGPPLLLPFICTQGPLPSTVADFWKMVDACKVSNIIMLCDTVELGKPKCEQYFPLTPGTEMTFGDYKVSIATTKTGEMDQKTERTTITTKLILQSPNGSTRKVRHFHYRTWPDKATPKAQDILGLLRILQHSRSNTPDHYSVVHCSAGIGRTGTLVAVEMMLHQILADPKKPLIPMEIGKKLRDQRPGAIQIDMQYVFMVICVLEYGTLLKYITNKQSIEEVKKMITEYDRRIGVETPKLAFSAEVIASPVHGTSPAEQENVPVATTPPVGKNAVATPPNATTPPAASGEQQHGMAADAQVKIVAAGGALVRWMASVASTQKSGAPDLKGKDAKK